MISFSFLSKRRGATLAGVFSLAFSCVLLLCGAGSVPIENLLPQGAMQGDLNAGGHNLTNAATVYATAVSAANVVVSGSLTAPSSFTLPFSQLTGAPTLGSLSSVSPTGTPSSTTFLAFNGTTYSWSTPAGGGGLPSIGSPDLLANTSGSSATPVDTSPSAYLDAVFGTTQGEMVERGASGWQTISGAVTAG